MDQLQLYGQQSEDEENNEIWLSIYQGIYEFNSTRGNTTYPIVRHLGNVNITRRQFIKRAKHPQKVLRKQENTIFINPYHEDKLIPLDVLFTELGCSTELQTIITHTVLTYSYDKTIKVNDNNRIGGENEGIIDF